MSITTATSTAPIPAVPGPASLVVDWWCDLACPDCTDALDVLDELRERFDDRRLVSACGTSRSRCTCGPSPRRSARSRPPRRDAARSTPRPRCALVDDVDGPGDYVELAEHLGLDADAVAEALFDGRHRGLVHDEAEAGRALGVRGTPTFVVDGLLVDASESLDGALEAARGSDRAGGLIRPGPNPGGLRRSSRPGAVASTRRRAARR